MTRPGWLHGLLAVLGGILLLLVLVLTAPSEIEIDVGGNEPAILSGVHGIEEQYDRHMRWTDGAARMEWTGQLGVLPTAVNVELAAFFGRAGEQVAVSSGTRTVRHRLQGDWEVVQVPVTTGPGGVVVDIRSERHSAPNDSRPLGIRLDRFSIVNGSPSQVLPNLRLVDAGIIILAGVIGWFTGLWLIDGTRYAGRSGARLMAAFACVTLLGMCLVSWRAWMLQAAGLRMLAGALLLAGLLVSLLRRRDACSRATALLVALGMSTTWLVAAVLTGQYFVDVPRWDIWETVPLIEKALAGTLTPSDMWSAHNEHRPMTGRLVVIGGAVFAHWNHWYELAASLTSAGVLLVLLAHFVARTQQRVQRIHPAILIVVAVFVCSLTQWENWLRGYHVHILMGAVAPAGALLILSCGPTTWLRLGMASSLAILGELSFGTGLLTWPIGAVVIAVRRGDHWQARLGLWIGVGAVAFASYFPGLPERPGRAEGMASVLTAFGMIRLVAGVLVTIAMPVAYVPQAFMTPATPTQFAVVLLAGTAVLAWALLVWIRWREDTMREYVWLFPAALAAFGVGACTLAGLGRAYMALYAMTGSRYLVFAACFWTGLLMLLGMRTARASSWALRAAAALVLVIAGAGATAWLAAVPFMEADALAGRRARAQLRQGALDDAAPVLYPDPVLLEKRRAVLLEHRLSVFRPGAH